MCLMMICFSMNLIVCFLSALVLFLILTLKTTRSCSPSCRTVPSSFIRRTKAMAKFFSLLSLAGDEGDGFIHLKRVETHKRGRRWREDSGIAGIKSSDLYNQVCVMMAWAIFQIAAYHSVFAMPHNAQGSRGEAERPILTLLGRAVSEHEA